jgi:hypothetical protein
VQTIDANPATKPIADAFSETTAKNGLDATTAPGENNGSANHNKARARPVITDGSSSRQTQ